MHIRLRTMRRSAGFAAAIAVSVLVAANLAEAAEPTVGLGNADSYAVLAGQGITNTGATTINGDVGSCPNPAIGVTSPMVTGGSIHANDAHACNAQSSLTTAYDDAAGRTPNTTFGGPTDLGNSTRLGGVYNSPSSFGITGTLTLDGENDPNTVWIFQAGSTLITATNSAVVLTRGAQACNVFWQVGSSATIDVDSVFVGTVMALTSIAANTRADIAGRLLARNGSVTLDTNSIRRPTCAAAVTTTTVAGATTTTSAVGATTTTSPVGATTTTTVAGATTTTSPVGATTTTSAVGATTTTTVAGATTTTVSPAPTTTTTAPAATTTSLAGVTTTAAPIVGAGSTTTTQQPLSPATPAVPVTTTELPLTGVSVLWALIAGGGAVALGTVAVRRSRAPLNP